MGIFQGDYHLRSATSHNRRTSNKLRVKNKIRQKLIEDLKHKMIRSPFALKGTRP